jgi:hypothetical protein
MEASGPLARRDRTNDSGDDLGNDALAVPEARVGETEDLSHDRQVNVGQSAIGREVEVSADLQDATAATNVDEASSWSCQRARPIPRQPLAKIAG